MKRFLLSIVGLLAFAIGMNAETYTHTFGEGELTTAGGNVTLSGMEWTASSANSIGWNAEKGIQLGKKNEVCENFSLTTSAFKDYTITSVTVYGCIASSGDAKVTIKAGNSTSEQYVLGASSTECKFECKEHGDIVISWNATQRAYYVSKIEVQYEIPADMVDVEEPTFKTPEGVYEKKVTVTAETDDQSLVLYYTLDGTDPSYEDFNSDPIVGTTKCSKYYVMYPELTASATIKVMAVKVDGESVYKSDIVESKYIVSPTKPYVPAKEIATGNKYAFVANECIADFLFDATNGFLQIREPSKIYDKYIESTEYNGFTFTETDGGYIIQDAENRYMYLAGNDGKISFAAEKPATGAVWSVAIDDAGNATIKNGNSTVYYSENNDVFGCYETAETDMVLPTLYMRHEYPQATITPENGSTVRGLKEFTIYCNEGIAVSDDFSIKAQGNQKEDRTYEIDKIYNCTQVDENTLKFTIEDELHSEDNIQIDLIITGNIYLNPDVMSYPMPIINKWANNICSFTHLGSAKPAKLLSITPENNSTIEEVSYFVFTFSKIGTSCSEDGDLQPRLYAEGITWNYILESTTTDSKGDMIAMDQLALKTSEPILGNGKYIFEIPTGYFIDRNGNNIEGTTLEFIVVNDSGLGAGIEDIIAGEETSWTVYNMTGVKVLDTENAEDLNNLPKGIYIINGNKVIVR